MFHRLWSVEIYGFLLLTTSEALISGQDSSVGHTSRSPIELNKGGDEVVAEKFDSNSSSVTGSRLTCSMNTGCFSMWVVEPGCWDGFLDVTRSGYIKMSLGIFHCQEADLGHYPFAVYWFWGSQLAYLKEISRCRHFTVCRIKALAMGYSSSSKHWLNILVNSTTSSFLGSISVATDLRLLKKDFFLVNTTRPTGFHTVTHNHTVLHGNTHSISLQAEETEKELRPGVGMETGRMKRDVNEAEDLAVLMDGENPEAKAKIVEMISTNYASGGFDDPVVSRSNTWSSKLGPKMGSMVQSLYSDLNSQSEAAQAETSSELDTISPDMIRLRQKIKSAEREIAHFSDQLNIANKKHEAAASVGGDTSETLWKKTQLERKLNYWTQEWQNMKNQYELTYKGSSRIGRRLQAYFYERPEWAEWSQWSKCSADCGDGGFSVRRRECFTLPTLACPGPGFDMQPCSTGIKCQAQFHEWGEWGPCSVTCGKGVRARSRVCVTGDREMKCKGPSTMLEKCTFPKCKPKPAVTAAPQGPVPNVAPVMAAPSVAYILSPGIAFGSGVYPVAQPAYGQQPGGEVVAVPELGGASQYHPHSLRAGGAAGFGAVAAGGAAAVAAGAVGAGAFSAGSGEAAKGRLSKVTVVETGGEGGPYVITHHETENPEEDQTVTPETILFIVLFLLCLLLLIIAFCIYFYQRTSDSKAQKKLKDARPFYKQDPGDDDDLDRQPAPGRVKPIIRPGFGCFTELNTPKEPTAPVPPAHMPSFVYPEELMYPEAMGPEQLVFPVSAAPSEQLVGGEGVPWYEDTVPPDQMMLAGQQVALDEIGQPEQGLALGESSTSEEEVKAKKKRKSGQGKALGAKRKSGEGKELGGKRKSAEGKELGGKRKSAEGKKLGGKKKSIQGDESDQSLVAGQKASKDKVPSPPKGDDKKKKPKKEKKAKAASGSSTPTSDVSESAEANPEDKSASNIAVDVSEQDEVDLRLSTQKRRRRTSLRDPSSGGSLWQDHGLPHASPLKRVPNTKEQYLPTLRSEPHLEIPVVEGKHIWALPLDRTQYLENLSSKRKTILNYSLLMPSLEQATPIGDTHDVFSNQEIPKGKGCQRFYLDTEGKLKPIHETKKWSGKVRKLRYRKRSYKRGERKMNTYLKSVFRQKCKHLRYEKYKQCQVDVGPGKNTGSGYIRSSQKSSRIQNYSESDTYPKDESPVSANSSYHSNRFSTAKTVNREAEVQWFMNQAKTFESDIGQECTPKEKKIFSCKTGDSLTTRMQALSCDHRSRSSLYYRFPFSVYGAQRQRRGKFTSSSSSSWLSTLLSESDRKLNEIERDMDAVLKEQCRVRERNTSSLSTQGNSGDTLQPSMNGVKNDDVFTTCQPENKSAKMSSKSPKPSDEYRSLQGESASKSETKCLEQSESGNSMEPVISEEPPKCDEDDNIHAYEKKKENILKLLHSTPLYQIRGQSLYYAEPWKPLQSQVIGGNQAYQSCRLLNSNFRSDTEHIKARKDTFLTPQEHTSFTNGTSLSSQATSAVWTDHDSKGYFKTSSDTSNVPPSSTNQQSSTDSSENNMHTTCVSLPFTSYSSLSNMWQTERNQFQKAAEVPCSLDNDNCNPNDDSWRNTQRTISEKSEEMSGRTHQEHVDVPRKPDVHGSIHVHVELQECPPSGFSAGGDGKHGQQTMQGQGIRRSEGCQMFLLNPRVKGQNSLDRQAGAATCRRSSNKKDGGREQADDKKDTRVKLAAAQGRTLVEDSTPACSYTDPLASSCTPADSTSVPASVLSSYQEHIPPQNNGKRSCDQSGPVSTKQGQAGYEHILDKQLEQFMDSTSWISTKDHSKIHIDWNVHKDSNKKMFDKLQRSKLSQDAHHFEESSISSTVTSTRGLDSGQCLPKSYNPSKPSGSMFHKQAVKQETYQKEFKEDQQCDRYNTVSAVQKQAWRIHDERLGKVFAKSSYQPCPEVSSIRDKTVSAPHEDKPASMSGEDATVTSSTKWYSACSDVPVSTHYYRTSSDVPSTPDTKRGPADTSNSLASACDIFATPESEMSWETSRTNGSPTKSTYESPCKSESTFYIRNTSCNSSSSIPCSLNRTFSLDSASSCNNSAVCDTSENMPNLSEYHSLKNTGQLTTSSSRNISSEDICIFQEVISSSESCSDNPVVSDKELLSCLGSLASRLSPTESSYFDLRKPEFSNICSSCPDNQSDSSKKKQNMLNQTQVKSSCSDYVCKENSSCEMFSEGEEIIKTSYNKERQEEQVSKEREDKQVCSPFQNHLGRLEIGLECNKAFIHELDSDSFDASPDLALPSPLPKLPLLLSAKELPLQGPFQTLSWSWSAESLVGNDFSGKNDDQDALTGVQQPGDQLTPVNNFDDFNPWETRIDYLSFVNEADTVGSQYSLKQNAAYDITGPHLESSRQAETPLSHAYSSDSSVSGYKIHMSKCPETGTRTGQAYKGPTCFDRKEEINSIVGPHRTFSSKAETPSFCHSSDSSFSRDKIHMAKCSEIGSVAGQASQDPIYLDKKHGSWEMNSISNDLIAGFSPRTDTVSFYGFRNSSDRNADPFQNATADRCCSPSYEDRKSVDEASRSKHSEMKYKEHFVQESKTTERHASVETQQKIVDNWNSSAEAGSTVQACGTEFDFQGFLCKGVKQEDSFTAKFELATVFYRRAIQWSPLFDGRTDDCVSDTVSICPSWSLDTSTIMGQTQTASSITERSDASHDVEPSWTLTPLSVSAEVHAASSISLRLDGPRDVQPSLTLNPSTIVEQTQTASVLSKRPCASHDVEPSWTLNPSSMRGQAQSASSISLRLNGSHDVQHKNTHVTSSTTTSISPSWSVKSSSVRGQAVAAASGTSLEFDRSCDVQSQNLCHRTKAYRNQTPATHNHQTSVDLANNCGCSTDFRNITTNKLNGSNLLENYNPLEKHNCLQESNILYTMFALKREEYIGCGDGCSAALDSHHVAAYCSENVDSKPTARATSVLSGTVFRSSSTPEDSLLMESDPRAGWMLTAETAEQQLVKNSHEKMFPLKLNSGDTDSSMSSCGSNKKQGNSDYMAQEICSVFTTNQSLYVHRTQSNTAAPDSLKDELHDLGKCREGKTTQGSVYSMVPDLHLAATVDDILETNAIPENMVCNRESSFLSSVNALVDLSPSDNYEHEMGSSSSFSGRQLSSGAGSHNSLLRGNDPQNLTDPDAWSCSRDFTLSCLQRSSSCSTGFLGGNEYCQRPVSWEGTALQECEYSHTKSQKSVLCSSPESIHSSILDASCLLDLSSDQNSDDCTNKHISVSCCGSCENNFHSTKRDAFLPSFSYSVEKHGCSQAIHGNTSADSSHYKNVFSYQENTFSLNSSSDEADLYQPERHDFHSCSCSSKSNLCVAENFSSNSLCSSNERHTSSSSHMPENLCFDNFHVCDQSVVNKNSPDSREPHDLSSTKSFMIFDESMCSCNDYPADLSCRDDCLSSSFMPERSSTDLGESSVDNAVRSDARSSHYPQTETCRRQELCRRQSFTHIQSEKSSLHKEVINYNSATHEPALMPTTSKHYPHVAASIVPELPIVHISHNLESHLRLDEYSKVANPSFNTEEPELVLYNCGRQPEVKNTSSSQSLARNNETASAEPRLLPASSKYYLQIDTSCGHELSKRNTSQAGFNLCPDECSEVTSQSFNTEEPELVLYNCGRQPEVKYPSCSQPLIGNNELTTADPMPAISTHYQKIGTTDVSELSNRNTSQAECNLCPAECSEVASQCFNTEDPELELYS